MPGLEVAIEIQVRNQTDRLLAMCPRRWRGNGSRSALYRVKDGGAV